MNRLIIVGAGGHGKVLLDIATKMGYSDISFLDDVESGDILGHKILGRVSEIEKFNIPNTGFIVGIGDNSIRSNIQKKYNLNWATLIHPSAQIGCGVSVGQGTVVMAGAVINPFATICRGCIINTCSSVDHNCYIEDFVHISPGAHLAGNVTVKQKTWIGAGAIISNNITVTNDCLIGAGAVVVKDIMESGTYIGLPAKRIEK